MIGINLISEEITALKHTDTGDTALLWMDDLKVSHLPVLKGNEFVGLVSESEIMNQMDLSVSLDQLFQHLPRPYVKKTTHIYDVMNLAVADHLTVVPVLDDSNAYIGSIGVLHLLCRFIENSSIKERGSIIVLEMSITDYMLSKISQIVESEDAKILNVDLFSNPSSNQLEVTLKINKTDIGSVIKALERYDYHIKMSFQKNSYYDDLKDRYDELMNYLNI